MKVDLVVTEIDRTGVISFGNIAAERPIKREHGLCVRHGEGHMIEAPDASWLLSGRRRADTSRTECRTGDDARGAPNKSTSGGFVCHVVPLLTYPMWSLSSLSDSRRYGYERRQAKIVGTFHQEEG